MSYYDDNPEDLEPEDYIEDYGEAGHSAWDTGNHKGSSARKNFSSPKTHGSYNEDDAALGIALLVIICCVVTFVLVLLIFG